MNNNKKGTAVVVMLLALEGCVTSPTAGIQGTGATFDPRSLQGPGVMTCGPDPGGSHDPAKMMCVEKGDFGPPASAAQPAPPPTHRQHSITAGPWIFWAGTGAIAVGLALANASMNHSSGSGGTHNPCAALGSGYLFDVDTGQCMSPTGSGPSSTVKHGHHFSWHFTVPIGH